MSTPTGPQNPYDRDDASSGGGDATQPGSTPPPPPGGGYGAAPPPPPGGGGYGAPPPPPPPSYGGGGGYGGYDGPTGTEKNSLGVWALVLGILSVLLSCFCIGIAAGIPAFILGKKSKDAAAAGQANNGGLGQAGFILGIVGTVLSIIFIIWSIVQGGVALQQWNEISQMEGMG